uniref:Prominin-like protein n=1 Tax=Haemonchus contortus TaxID=6289 RepID=A0A7I4YFD4_HAECO
FPVHTYNVMQLTTKSLLVDDEADWNHTSNVCTASFIANYTHMQRNYGKLKKFYYGAENVMRFVISTVDDQTIERVAAALRNPKEASDLIIADVFRNGYIIAVIAICLFISFITLVACILQSTLHLFGGNKRPPSTGTITCALISFVFCFIMAAIGTYLFASSIKHMNYGLNSLPEQLNKSSSDMSLFVKGFSGNLRCNFLEGKRTLELNINSYIVNISAILSTTKKRLDPQSIAKIPPSVQKTRNEIDKARKLLTYLPGPDGQELDKSTDRLILVLETVIAKALQEKLEIIKQNLILIRSDIDTSISRMGSQREAMLSELTVYKGLLVQVINALDQQLQHFQYLLFGVVTEHDYAKKASRYLSFTIFLPLILLVLSATGLTFLVVRCIFNFGNKEADEEFPIRNELSDIGAKTLNIGGYLALFITSLLFLMLALFFTTAFTSMFVCMGLFEDYDLRLLHALPSQEYKMKLGKHEVRFTLYDIFYKCKNGFSFFDAIDGDKIWARDEIGKKLSALRVNKFRRSMRNIHIGPELVNQLNSAVMNVTKELPHLHSARESLSKIDVHEAKILSGEVVPRVIEDNEKLKKFLAALRNLLADLSSRSNRDKLSKDIQNRLHQAELAIINSVARLLSLISDLSPQCEGLMSIWNDLGFFVCDIIAAPAQGLWMACLFSAIGAIFIYFALINGTRFLYNYADEKGASLSMAPQPGTLPELPDQPVPRTTSSYYSAPPSVNSFQPQIGHVEWIPVDEAKQRLFQIPPGVNFMPVMIWNEHAKSLMEGERMLSHKRPPLQRAVWVPSDGCFTQGTWERMDDDKLVEAPLTSVATALELSPTKSKKDKAKVPPTRTKGELQHSEEETPAVEQESATDFDEVKVDPSYKTALKKANDGTRLTLPPKPQPSDTSLPKLFQKDGSPDFSTASAEGIPTKSQDVDSSSKQQKGAAVEKSIKNPLSSSMRSAKTQRTQKGPGPKQPPSDQQRSISQGKKVPEKEKPPSLLRTAKSSGEKGSLPGQQRSVGRGEGGSKGEQPSSLSLSGKSSKEKGLQSGQQPPYLLPRAVPRKGMSSTSPFPRVGGPMPGRQQELTPSPPKNPKKSLVRIRSPDVSGKESSKATRSGQ